MKIERALTLWVSPVVLLLAIAGARPVEAQQASSTETAGTQKSQTVQQALSPGLLMPSMDPGKGRKLFASKGCVVCHSVNGIGGTDAAALDASTMVGMTNPFDFVANMWRGAQPMIELQQKELGGQVEFTGQELADIIAFLHDEAEQKKLSETDFPPNIKAALDKMKEGESGSQGMKDEMSKMKMKP